MGCLIQLFFEVLARVLWYFVIYPIMTIFFFLKDVGLIWSISFYVLTHYLFLDTFIQDYRIIFTVLLLIPFFFKVIRQVSLTVTRFTMWREKRRLKKERGEEGDNYYGEE